MPILAIKSNKSLVRSKYFFVPRRSSLTKADIEIRNKRIRNANKRHIRVVDSIAYDSVPKK